MLLTLENYTKEVTITLLNRIPGAEKLGLVSNMSNLSLLYRIP